LRATSEFNTETWKSQLHPRNPNDFIKIKTKLEKEYTKNTKIETFKQTLSHTETAEESWVLVLVFGHKTYLILIFVFLELRQLFFLLVKLVSGKFCMLIFLIEIVTFLFFSWDSLHVGFSLRETRSLIFLVVKIILFIQLVACWFSFMELIACWFLLVKLASRWFFSSWNF